MTLEEILTDSKVPDDLEIDFPNVGKVKVSDLRALRTSVSKERETVKQRLAQIEDERKRVADLASQAAALNEELQKASKEREEGGKTREQGTDWDADPLLGPFAKARLTPLEAKMAEISKSIEMTNRMLTDQAKVYLAERYRNMWESQVPKEHRPEGKTWRDYLKTAQERGLNDEFGLPDPVRAWREEAAPKLEEQRSKAAYEEGLKKGREETAAQRYPAKPGSFQIPQRSQGKDKTYDSLDSLLSDAWEDPDIQRIAEGITPS